MINDKISKRNIVAVVNESSKLLTPLNHLCVKHGISNEEFPNFMQELLSLKVRAYDKICCLRNYLLVSNPSIETVVIYIDKLIVPAQAKEQAEYLDKLKQSAFNDPYRQKPLLLLGMLGSKLDLKIRCQSLKDLDLKHKPEKSSAELAYVSLFLEDLFKSDYDAQIKLNSLDLFNIPKMSLSGVFYHNLGKAIEDAAGISKWKQELLELSDENLAMVLTGMSNIESVNPIMHLPRGYSLFKPFFENIKNYEIAEKVISDMVSDEMLPSFYITYKHNKELKRILDKKLHALNIGTIDKIEVLETLLEILSGNGSRDEILEQIDKIKAAGRANTRKIASDIARDNARYAEQQKKKKQRRTNFLRRKGELVKIAAKINIKDDGPITMGGIAALFPFALSADEMAEVIGEAHKNSSEIYSILLQTPDCVFHFCRHQADEEHLCSSNYHDRMVVWENSND